MECIITKLQLYYLCLFSGEICIYWYCVRCLNDCFVLLLFFQCNAALQAKHLVIHRYFTIKWQISGKIRLLRSVCGEQWGRAAIIIHWLRCLWQNMNYQKKKKWKTTNNNFPHKKLMIFNSILLSLPLLLARGWNIHIPLICFTISV